MSVYAGWGHPQSPGFPIEGKPKPVPRNTATLRGLLAWGEREHEGVMKLLKVLPQDLPENATLLEREGQLAHLIKQVQGQLANWGKS